MQKLQLVEVRCLFIYLPNSSTCVSNLEVPQKPSNMDERKRKSQSTYYLIFIWDPPVNFIFYLYHLEVNKGFRVAILVSGNFFCKSYMNGIANTLILNVGYLQSIVLKFGGLRINTRIFTILTLLFHSFPSR